MKWLFNLNKQYISPKIPINIVYSRFKTFKLFSSINYYLKYKSSPRIDLFASEFYNKNEVYFSIWNKTYIFALNKITN